MRKLTLGELLEDPTVLFSQVEKLFPLVDWEIIHLDGPDIRDLINIIRTIIRGEEGVWNTVIEATADMKTLVKTFYEIYLEEHPSTSQNSLVQLEQAVHFTSEILILVTMAATIQALVEPDPATKALIEKMINHFEELDSRKTQRFMTPVVEFKSDGIIN